MIDWERQERDKKKGKWKERKGKGKKGSEKVEADRLIKRDRKRKRERYTEILRNCEIGNGKKEITERNIGDKDYYKTHTHTQRERKKRKENYIKRRKKRGKM